MFNKQNIILFILGLVIFYLILIKYFSNKKIIKISKKETFENNDKVSVCLTEKDEDNIIFPKSNLNNLTLTENIFFDHNFTNDKIKGCKLNKLPAIVDKNILRYPIQIILYKYNTIYDNTNIDNYIYLALFNDGGIYSTEDIKQAHWDGPLTNSLINEGQTNEDVKLKPLRNICLSKEGELLGISFDGKVYIKTVINNKQLKHYEMPWKKSDKFKDNIKYLMFNENEDYYIITQESEFYMNGKKKEFKTEDEISVNPNKIFKDYNNYLLVIDNNDKLYKSVDNTYNTKEKSIKLMKEFNNTKLVDIIYDKDKTLIGLGIPEKGLKKNETKLLQQKNKYFLSKFDLIENIFNKLPKVLYNKDIIRFKNNINVEKKDEIKSLDELYIKEKEIDQKKFREFCGEKFKGSKMNLEIENEIKINDYKLKELTNTINNLKQDKFNN